MSDQIVINKNNQTAEAILQVINTKGFQYHVRLAPGVKFGDDTTKMVRDAVLENLTRIQSPVGGQFDIDLGKLF